MKRRTSSILPENKDTIGIIGSLEKKGYVRIIQTKSSGKFSRSEKNQTHIRNRDQIL